MSTEQLPDGLRNAVELPDGDRDAFIAGQHNPLTGLDDMDEAIVADYANAIDAIRSEHAQRVALMHHAADLARDLETERLRLTACGVIAISDTPESAAKARQMLPIYESASASDVARRVDECMALRQRVADLEAERDELRAKLDAAQHELNCAETEIESAMCALPDGATPTEYECLGGYIRAVTRALIKERDDLHARLAEIEEQEPAAEVVGQQRNALYTVRTTCFDLPPGMCLYARPVPAIPAGWRLVKSDALAMVVNALRRDAEDGRQVRGEMADELLAAAPEAAR